ncbi:hypothetical protein EC5905_3120, partial [Escherichia coli 5905]
MFTTQPRGK